LPILGCAPALDACDLGAMIIPSPRSPLSPTLGYSHAVHVPRCAPTPFIAPRAFIPIPFYRAQPALLPHSTSSLDAALHCAASLCPMTRDATRHPTLPEPVCPHPLFPQQAASSASSVSASSATCTTLCSTLALVSSRCVETSC
jgi:hypothetical protein